MSPPAELIQACRDLDVVTAKRRTLYDYEPGSIADGAEATVETIGELLCHDYAEARSRIVNLPCVTLLGLFSLAKSMLQADVADLSFRLKDGDEEFALINKVLQKLATLA